jgi:hypothetical protein
MVHILRKASGRCGLVVGVAALCFALAASGPSARSQSSDDPQYAPGGDLILPNGFDTWVFVGSNVGLSYTPDAAAAASAPPPRTPGQPQFHNVSINKAAYDYFLANGRFPERTVLVMQVFEAADKEPRSVLASGVLGLRARRSGGRRPPRYRLSFLQWRPHYPNDRTRRPAKAARAAGQLQACLAKTLPALMH